MNELLDLLVKAGADLTPSGAFFALCGTERLDLVERAVEAGADAHLVDAGRSALQSATSADRLEVMRYLLALEVDPDVGAPQKTPLHYVRSIEALEHLVEAGANPLLRGQRGDETPLHTVTRQWNIDGPRWSRLWNASKNSACPSMRTASTAGHRSSNSRTAPNRRWPSS